MQRPLTTEKDITNVLQDSILILQEFFSMNSNYGSYSIEEGSSSTCVLSYTLPNMITHQRSAMQAMGFGLLNFQGIALSSSEQKSLLSNVLIYFIARKYLENFFLHQRRVSLQELIQELNA